MLAVKAVYDGDKIVLPEKLTNMTPGDVIVLFEVSTNDSGESEEWMKLQEGTFAKAWDNDEDSIYDTL
mgnify:CR=1 FL=1